MEKPVWLNIVEKRHRPERPTCIACDTSSLHACKICRNFGPENLIRKRKMQEIFASSKALLFVGNCSEFISEVFLGMDSGSRR